MKFHVAMRRGLCTALPHNETGRLLETREAIKAEISARVEHPVHAMKNLFRHRKVC